MSPSKTGARSATGRNSSPLAWLPWALLLVLALVIALIVLIVVNANDDDDDIDVGAPDSGAYVVSTVPHTHPAINIPLEYINHV